MRDAPPYEGAAVVIPTRNRAALTANAIRSVLDSPARGRTTVLVSDNSTSAEESAQLSAFCRDAADPRLVYVTPPEPLAMTAHWEWAMARALELPGATHFVYLTDRSLFRPGELAAVTDIAARHPGRVVSYGWVTIYDHLRPIRVERLPFTGGLVEVRSARLLALSALSEFPVCLPRMMNCCAPRGVIEAVARRFGSVFSSVSPDYNFCYRCLDVVDSILYYDRPAFVSYALHRSNGASAMRGVSTRDRTDFLAALGGGSAPPCSAAPVPALDTVANYITHEYCAVRREAGGGKFPEVDRERYLARNALEVSYMENPEARLRMEALLRESGYVPPAAGRGLGARLSELRTRLSLRTRVRNALRRAQPGSQSQPAVAPAPPGDETFETLEDAMSFAVALPAQAAAAGAPHLDALRD